MKVEFINTPNLGSSYIVYHDGNSVLHREDGPVIEWDDGSRAWYFNGSKHRLDGPAIQLSSGSEEYWVHGRQIKK